MCYMAGNSIYELLLATHIELHPIKQVRPSITLPMMCSNEDLQNPILHYFHGEKEDAKNIEGVCPMCQPKI